MVFIVPVLGFKFLNFFGFSIFFGRDMRSRRFDLIYLNVVELD